MEKMPDVKEPKTNILKFPIEQRVPDGVIIPPEFKIRQTQEYLTVLCDEITTAIIGTLAHTGVDCTNEEFDDDIEIIKLMIHSMLYRTEKLEHPLNPVIESLADSLLYTEEEPEDS